MILTYLTDLCRGSVVSGLERISASNIGRDDVESDEGLFEWMRPI